MTEEGEEDFDNKNTCRFCEKEILIDKDRDHCHLTGKYRGPAHNNCKTNVTKDHSTFIPFMFHKFSNYDCHLFYKNLVDKKKDKVKLKIIPKTNEENISVTYDSFRLIDSDQFLSISLNSLVNTIVDNSPKTLKDLDE